MSRKTAPVVEKPSYSYLVEDVRVDFGRGLFLQVPVTLLTELIEVTAELAEKDFSVWFDDRGFLRVRFPESPPSYVTTSNTGNRIKRKVFKKTGLVELYQVPPPAPRSRLVSK